MTFHHPVTVKQITQANELWPLRHNILRPGQPIEASQYPEDDHPDAISFGAYDQNNILIGIASLYPSALSSFPSIIDKSLSEKIGWRLRGMAVDPAYHNKKIGTTLLKACYEHISNQSKFPRGIWCNARSPAIPYYMKNGWTALGDEFEIPNAGPHFVMVNLDPISR
jgi:GNAT superfamily N-acetyltransferase